MMGLERASGVSDKQVAAMSSLPSPPPASRRGYQAWIGTAVVVLLVGLCLFNLFGRQQPPTLPVAERNTQPTERTPLHTFVGFFGGVNSVCLSPDGALLALGSDDYTVHLWRVSDGAPLHTLKGHKGVVIGVSFSSDNALLASGSVDGTVKLWRVR